MVFIVLTLFSPGVSAEVTAETFVGSFLAYDSGCYMGDNGIYQQTAIRIEDHTVTKAEIGYSDPSCSTSSGAYVVQSTYTISYAHRGVFTLVRATRRSLQLTDEVLVHGARRRFHLRDCSGGNIPTGSWVNTICSDMGRINEERFQMGNGSIQFDTFTNIPGGRLNLVNSGISDLGLSRQREQRREEGITVTPLAPTGTN